MKISKEVFILFRGKQEGNLPLFIKSFPILSQGVTEIVYLHGIREVLEAWVTDVKIYKYLKNKTIIDFSGIFSVDGIGIALYIKTEYELRVWGRIPRSY